MGMIDYRFDGDWEKIKYEVKKRWDQLTDDDLNRIDGSTDLLAGAIQKYYGSTFREALLEIRIWRSDPDS
jgi:uncharacterized protein YjbJ (UPF0337 family)